MVDPVLAADTWSDNSMLMLDMLRLGYLADDMHILDPTYGRGTWWKHWCPKHLHTSDLKTGTDFRELPWQSNSFGAVVFDPPYVAIGGRATSTLVEFNDRYGLDTTPLTPYQLSVMNESGLTECARVTGERGFILVKSMDYISSGKLWEGTYRIRKHAETLGLEMIDRIEHVGVPRAQPGGRKQVHARRNYSTLQVFRKPR